MSSVLLLWLLILEFGSVDIAVRVAALGILRIP